MAKSKPEQTVQDIKDTKEAELLRAGTPPAEAAREVSKLGLAVKRNNDLQAALIALVDSCSTMTLAEVVDQVIELYKLSDLPITDLPSLVSKLTTVRDRTKAAAERIAAGTAAASDG